MLRVYLSYLIVSKSIQDEFFQYFSNALTPLAAENVRVVKLTTNFNKQDFNIIKTSADVKINLTERLVFLIFDNWG